MPQVTPRRRMGESSRVMGWPSKGPSRAKSWSRMSALTLGSPLSAASIQVMVAGASLRQSEVALATGDGVVGDGKVVDERAVVEEVEVAGLEGEDIGLEREGVGGEAVAERAVELLEEDVFAVGRGVGGVDEALDGEEFHGAGERDEGELGGGVEGEDGLVVGSLEHCLRRWGRG